jgi:(2Fe-2S) ferredoxin
MLFLITDMGLNNADGLIFDCEDSTTFTPKTNIFTAEQKHKFTALAIDQQTDNLYAIWVGIPADTWQGDLGVYSRLSGDGGTTWGAVSARYNDAAYDQLRAVWQDISIGIGGGRIEPVWNWTSGGNVTRRRLTNFTNSIEIAAAPGPPPVAPPDIVPPGGTYGAAPGAPAGTILYITPDGIQYPLVTPHVTGRFVMSMSGGGAAPIQYISQRGPNQDGETVRDFSLTPRVIQILERQQFKSRGTWWDGRADILNDLRPNRQATATAVVTGTFRIVTANGDVRDLNVFIQDGPRFEARNVDEWDEWAFEEVLRFIAHDPLWFDPTRVDFDLTFALDAALVFPITFDTAVPTDDIIFGAGQVDVSVNLDYVGTWASLPTIVITGPLNNLIIDNVTTGETLALLRNIDPGRTVTIDLAFGQKTIVDDLGNNLLGSLSTDSDLGTWHIAPTPEAPQVAGQPRPTARNIIRLRGSAPTGATSVQVRYFTRYFGI